MLRSAKIPYQLVPIDWHASAVDVGGVSIFEILQAGVARLLQSVRGNHECKIWEALT
jgi:hypothetical protein